jgi:hypothetical protein
MQQQCRLVLPGATTCGEVILALPVAGLGPLRAAAERHFGEELQGKVRGAGRLWLTHSTDWRRSGGGGSKGRLLPRPVCAIAGALRCSCSARLLCSLTRDPLLQDFVITDTLKVFDSDDDVAALRDGATLVLASAADRVLAAPARERISFQPHPKTLTMAGEFEYFAAQVRMAAGGAAGCQRTQAAMNATPASQPAACNNVLSANWLRFERAARCRGATPLCMPWPSL